MAAFGGACTQHAPSTHGQVACSWKLVQGHGHKSRKHVLLWLLQALCKYRIGERTRHKVAHLLLSKHPSSTFSRPRHSLHLAVHPAACEYIRGQPKQIEYARSMQALMSRSDGRSKCLRSFEGRLELSANVFNAMDRRIVNHVHRSCHLTRYIELPSCQCMS